MLKNNMVRMGSKLGLMVFGIAWLTSACTAVPADDGQKYSEKTNVSYESILPGPPSPRFALPLLAEALTFPTACAGIVPNNLEIWRLRAPSQNYRQTEENICKDNGGNEWRSQALYLPTKGLAAEHSHVDSWDARGPAGIWHGYHFWLTNDRLWTDADGYLEWDQGSTHIRFEHMDLAWSSGLVSGAESYQLSGRGTVEWPDYTSDFSVAQWHFTSSGEAYGSLRWLRPQNTWQDEFWNGKDVIINGQHRVDIRDLTNSR